MTSIRVSTHILSCGYRLGYTGTYHHVINSRSVRNFNRWSRLLISVGGSPGLLAKSQEPVSQRCGVLCCYASTLPSSLESLPSLDVGSIPEPPMIPTIEPDLIAQVVDHSLRGLGLGSYVTPVGWTQIALDSIHAYTGLPWWGTIVMASIVMRLLLLPVMVAAQRNAAKLHNTGPESQRLQNELLRAKRSGDASKIALVTFEQQIFMKEKGINPFNQFKVIGIQAAVFITYFWSLRGMAKAHVAGMDSEGLWWFHDLTAADPTFILPFLSCVTILAVLEVGTDSGVRLGTMGYTKWVMRLLPFITFYFIQSFPAAILCYWTVSNMISLFLAVVFKMPAVRELLKIDALIKHPPKTQQPGVRKAGFMQNIRETMESNRIAADVARRATLDAERFRAAGKGKIPKTYAYDPRKMRDLIDKGPEAISEKVKAR